MVFQKIRKELKSSNDRYANKAYRNVGMVTFVLC